MSTCRRYKGYRRHRNREEERKVCEEFLKQFDSSFKFGSYECFEGKYEFVTDKNITDDVKARMVKEFGVDFEKDDNVTHIILYANREWVNPLLINDLLFGACVIGAWLPLGALTCYSFYFYLIH